MLSFQTAGCFLLLYQSHQSLSDSVVDNGFYLDFHSFCLTGEGFSVAGNSSDYVTDIAAVGVKIIGGKLDSQVLSSICWISGA